VHTAHGLMGTRTANDRRTPGRSVCAGVLAARAEAKVQTHSTTTQPTRGYCALGCARGQTLAARAAKVQHTQHHHTTSRRYCALGCARGRTEEREPSSGPGSGTGGPGRGPPPSVRAAAVARVNLLVLKNSKVNHSAGIAGSGIILATGSAINCNPRGSRLSVVCGQPLGISHG
jgi:hypothetical protein